MIDIPQANVKLVREMIGALSVVDVNRPSVLGVSWWMLSPGRAEQLISDERLNIAATFSFLGLPITVAAEVDVELWQEFPDGVEGPSAAVWRLGQGVVKP